MTTPTQTRERISQRRQDHHRGSQHGRRFHAPFVPALKTAEGAAALAAMKQQASDQARKIRKVMLCLAVIAAAVGGVLCLGQSGWENAFFGPAGLLLLFGVMYRPAFTLSRNAYYSIPGTRDADDEHRCFACGNRGIYRHGQYKSTAQHADCSKCGVNLWVD